MDRTVAFGAIGGLFVGILLAVLFGNSGIPKEKYDALSASCEKEKLALGTALATEEEKEASAARGLADCQIALGERAVQLDNANRNIAALQKDSDRLSSIEAENAKIGKYSLALSYFNEGYAQGMIPSSAKNKKIEQQMLSLGDSAIYAKWKAVVGCSNVVDCADAKKDFSDSIALKISSLEHSLSAFIPSNGTSGTLGN